MTLLKSMGVQYQGEIPFATGYSRYLVNYENVHKDGREFISPIKFDNLFIETHKSKIGA